MPWKGPHGETVRVSHVVMQEEGDPVGGIVQEHQPLQEAGQERGRLLHKHGQKHPGERLEDTWQGSWKAWSSRVSVLYNLARFGGSRELCRPCFSVPSSPLPPHLPPWECPPVLVTESTASPRSPAIGDIVSQVIQLQLLEETGREARQRSPSPERREAGCTDRTGNKEGRVGTESLSSHLCCWGWEGPAAQKGWRYSGAGVRSGAGTEVVGPSLGQG